MSDALHVPGQPRRSDNPLTALTDALSTQTQVLTEGFNKILTVISASQRHVYALEPVDNEQGLGFMSYCYACSEANARFVHPCMLMRPQALTVPPPTFLVAPPGDEPPAPSP